MNQDVSKKNLQENVTEEQKKDRKPKEWETYTVFAVYCGITIALTLLGAIWRCKVLTHMVALSFLGSAVVLLSVFTYKDWKSIVATILTLPVVVYILYTIFMCAD